jgi:hypothetical protein
MVPGIDPSDAIGSHHLPDRRKEPGSLLEFIFQVVVVLVCVNRCSCRLEHITEVPEVRQTLDAGEGVKNPASALLRLHGCMGAAYCGDLCRASSHGRLLGGDCLSLYRLELELS